MRIIDADALPSALFQKHVHDEEELEPMLYFEDAVKVVENAPTIDAIPVAWLREKIKEHTDDEGWEDYLANSFGLCIEEWQKEQEMR